MESACRRSRTEPLESVFFSRVSFIFPFIWADAFPPATTDCAKNERDKRRQSRIEAISRGIGGLKINKCLMHSPTNYFQKQGYAKTRAQIYVNEGSFEPSG